MPIKKSHTGALVWENPTPESIQAFKRNVIDISESTAAKAAETTNITNQLEKFMVETLNGAKRLADSNITLLNSLNTVVSRQGLGIVDIIIPVYGGLYILKESIRTIEQRTNWPHRITIVDDCSPDEKTRDYLRSLQVRWAEEKKPHQVLFNKKNKGFSATVNTGIKATNGFYICVFNSDVLVTDNWLSKMVLALESDSKNQIVNPCTNNTAMIDVPMQPGASYINMNRALEKVSSHRYPEIMPTGFCFMLRRSLTRHIGFLDEGFENYGEETDYWMRTITHVTEGEYPRWRAVLADDTYLFHERGSSFSGLGHSIHMAKRVDGAERFKARWPTWKNWQKSFDVKKTMAPIRSTLPMASMINPKSRYNIAFVTYSTAYCGGMKFIADIVNRLLENNVNVKVVQIKRDPTKPIQDTLGELRCAPILFDDPADIIKNFKARVFEKGVLVAATNELASIVKEICKGDDKLTSILFAQSHDPLISPDLEMKKHMEAAYKSVDHIISNAQWLNEDIYKSYKVKTLGYVRPGFDNDIFFPRDRELGDDRPTVMFSLLKSYPFKGYDRGVAVAKALSGLIRKNNENFRLMAIGINQVHECPDLICMGGVAPNYLAKLLSTEVDIFVDPSHVHTYGLPALEAMACGAVPVMWDNYGVNEYATHTHDSLIFPKDTTPEALANEIFTLLKDKIKLNNLKAEAVKVNQNRIEAVNKFTNILENTLKVAHNPKNIAIITPHLRKRGGPTTIMDIANKLHDKGHKVDMYTLYSDLNTELLTQLKVPIHIDWKNIKPCDLLITNSDNPENPFFSGLKQVKKKALLKLSHNKRFQKLEDNSLNIKWDHIITSTKWLAEVCAKPDLSEGWTYKPQVARRLGWYHYDHEDFASEPAKKLFRPLEGNTPIVIGTLAHHYPLKGTPDTMKVLDILKQKYGPKLYILTVGEQGEWAKQKPEWCEFMFSPSRKDLAQAMSQVDIWLNFSHTEGLGRMSLEAMSASCGLVVTDTGAEFASNDKNCLIAPVGSIRRLAEATERLIIDHVLRRTLATNAFATAQKWSDSSAYAQDLDRIVQEIFNGS